MSNGKLLRQLIRSGAEGDLDAFRGVAKQVMAEEQEIALQGGDLRLRIEYVEAARRREYPKRHRARTRSTIPMTWTTCHLHAVPKPRQSETPGNYPLLQMKGKRKNERECLQDL